MIQADILFLRHYSSILRQSSCMWFMEEPSQFSVAQTAQSLTCSIMEKPRTGLDDCLIILLPCFKKRCIAALSNATNLALPDAVVVLEAGVEYSQRAVAVPGAAGLPLVLAGKDADGFAALLPAALALLE